HGPLRLPVPRGRVHPAANAAGADPVPAVHRGRRAAHPGRVAGRSRRGAALARAVGGGLRARAGVGPAVFAAGGRSRRTALRRDRRRAAHPVAEGAVRLGGWRGVRSGASAHRRGAVGRAGAGGRTRWLNPTLRPTTAATPTTGSTASCTRRPGSAF